MYQPLRKDGYMSEVGTVYDGMPLCFNELQSPSTEEVPSFLTILYLHLVGLSSIPPVSVNRQEILADYRYLGYPKISIHMKTPSW